MSRTAEVPPFLQVAAFVGATWYSGLLGQAWDSWSVHYARIQTEKVRVEAIRKDGYESAFRVVCPDYFAASWADRNLGLWNIRWCKAYEDRL